MKQKGYLIIVLVGLMLLGGAPHGLSAVHPELDEICKTWSGLDKSSRPKSLYRVTLKLEAVGSEEIVVQDDSSSPLKSAKTLPMKGGQTTDSLQSTAVSYASPFPWSAPRLAGDKIKGTVTASLIDDRATQAATPMVTRVEGVYFPEIGLLRYKPVEASHYVRGVYYAVFNEQASEMSLVFTGSLGNNPPIGLYAGEEIPASIRELAKLGDSGQALSESQNSRTPTGLPQKTRTQGGRFEPDSSESSAPHPGSREARQKEMQSIRLQYQEDSKALQQRISEATRARDKARVAALREKQKQLRLDYNKRVAAARAAPTTRTPQSRGAPNRNPSSGSQPTDNCPEHILAWVNEMESNGATLQIFNGYLELANLFRPSVFIPHFGKPFEELTDKEYQDLGYQIQIPCLRAGGPFANSGIRTALVTLITRPTHWGKTEMGIAGTANENVAAWIQRNLRYFESEAKIPEIKTFREESDFFLRLLWPDERIEVEKTLPLAENRAMVDLIEGELSGVATRLDQDDFNAIHAFQQLKTSAMFEALLPEEIGRMRARLDQVALEAIQRSIDRLRTKMESPEDPEEKNHYALEWWEHGRAAFDYFPKRLDLDSFSQWFGDAREKTWSDWKTNLFKRIDAIDDLYLAKTFVFEISVQPIDGTYCPTWQVIEAKAKERIKEIEYERFLTRVGEGPFGPEYPGAILLNAVYRNDRRQVARENDLLIESLLMSLQPVDQLGVRRMVLETVHEDGTREVVSDGFTYLDPWGGRLHTSARRSSFIEPLLIFFASAYTHFYPDCLDANLVPTTSPSFTRLLVEKSAKGSLEIEEPMMLSPSINSRHAAPLTEMRNRDNETRSVIVPGTLDETQVVKQYVNPFVTVWRRGDGYMYDSIFRGDWDEAQEDIRLLTDALHGLRNAMQERSCDDPVIQQLDKHLLEMYADGTGRKF